MLFHQWDLATLDTFDRGMVLEEDVEHINFGGEKHVFTQVKANPTFRRSVDVSARRRMIGEELDLFNYAAIQNYEFLNGPIREQTND